MISKKVDVSTFCKTFKLNSIWYFPPESQNAVFYFGGKHEKWKSSDVNPADKAYFSLLIFLTDLQFLDQRRLRQRGRACEFICKVKCRKLGSISATQIKSGKRKAYSRDLQRKNEGVPRCLRCREERRDAFDSKLFLSYRSRS